MLIDSKQPSPALSRVESNISSVALSSPGVPQDALISAVENYEKQLDAVLIEAGTGFQCLSTPECHSEIVQEMHRPMIADPTPSASSVHGLGRQNDAAGDGNKCNNNDVSVNATATIRPKRQLSLPVEGAPGKWSLPLNQAMLGDQETASTNQAMLGDQETASTLAGTTPMRHHLLSRSLTGRR